MVRDICACRPACAPGLLEFCDCTESFQRGDMRRREFITAVGGSVTWSLAARAQQLAGVPRVIQLAPVQIQAQIDATRRILRELGYVEGRNIRLEFRDAAGNVDALPAVAQEL